MRVVALLVLCASCRWDLDRIEIAEGDGARASGDGGASVGDGESADSFIWPGGDGPVLIGDATCSGIGQRCGFGWQPCLVPLACYEGVNGGVCSTDRATCGGFAGAECPTDAPNCLSLPGTDYGVCANDLEMYCICTGPARDAVICPF